MPSSAAKSIPFLLLSSSRMDTASTLVLSNSWETDKESANRSWCNSSQALRYSSDPPSEYPPGSRNGNSKGELAQLSSCIRRRTPRTSAGKDRAQHRALSAFIWLPNVRVGAPWVSPRAEGRMPPTFCWVWRELASGLRLSKPRVTCPALSLGCLLGEHVQKINCPVRNTCRAFHTAAHKDSKDFINSVRPHSQTFRQ